MSVFFFLTLPCSFLSDPNQLFSRTVRCLLFASPRPRPNTRTFLWSYDMCLYCYLLIHLSARPSVCRCPQRALWKSMTFLGISYFLISARVKLTVTYRIRKRMAPESNELGSQPFVCFYSLHTNSSFSPLGRRCTLHLPRGTSGPLQAALNMSHYPLWL